MTPDVVSLLDNASWPAFLVDTEGTVQRANALAVKNFGPSNGTPVSFSAIWVAENGNTPQQLLAQWAQGPSPAIPLKFKLNNGAVAGYSAAVCPFAENGRNLFLVQLLPSAQRNGEAGQQESGTLNKQKLDCALQLARSVALDFNNALTSVLGHASLLLGKAEPNHPWRPSLLEVEKSAAKAAEIANDLAAFSRREKDTRPQSDGNVNVLAQRCAELFQRSAPPEIKWNLRLERKLFTARFEEAKIQQALAKILENAMEAIPGAGQISLQSRNVELAEPTQDRTVRLAAGAYVCVEVSDTGKGIDPGDLPRIFEPFFTTKRNHRGLGLVLANGIVTNHGGGIAVSSAPGSGTSVRVYLPAQKRFVSDSATVGDNLGGKETILIVDDEDLLLTMGDMILSEFGYCVLTANNGKKALEMISKGDPAVHLVITDLVMPAMGGRELADQIRRASPDIRVICTSGYVWPGSNPDSAGYLQKPFTSQELLVKVRQALDADAPATE